MAESDTDRLKRVAGGVRRKLMGMAAKEGAAKVSLDKVEVRPASEDDKVDNESKRRVDADERAADFSATPQPGQDMRSLPSQDEVAEKHAEKRAQVQSESATKSADALSSAAEKGTGNDDFKLGRRLGKTSRGIVGAYRANK